MMGTISKFDLSLAGFSIPMKLKSTATRSRLRFKNACPDCEENIKQKRICPNQECATDEVGYSSLKKKYEYGDNYVSFDKEKLDAVKEEVGGGVTIKDVVDVSSIQLLHAQKSYFVGTEEDDKLARKKYTLLSRALEQKQSALVVEYAIRSRPSLYAMWSQDGRLYMTKMAYEDNIQEHMVEPVDVDDERVGKVAALLEKAKDKTDGDMKDKYRERLEDAIETVASGGNLDVDTEDAPDSLDQELDMAL